MKVDPQTTGAQSNEQQAQRRSEQTKTAARPEVDQAVEPGPYPPRRSENRCGQLCLLITNLEFCTTTFAGIVCQRQDCQRESESFAEHDRRIQGKDAGMTMLEQTDRKRCVMLLLDRTNRSNLY